MTTMDCSMRNSIPLLLLLFILVISVASALLVPRISTHCNNMVVNGRQDKVHHKSSSCTTHAHSLLLDIQRRRDMTMKMMIMDPTDILLTSSPYHDPQQTLLLLDHHLSATPSSFDWLTSFTLAKASSSIAVIPNQSIAPLSETIQSAMDNMNNNNNNILEVIPDLPSMPGGVPRTGNAFLSGSFRDLYQAPIAPPNPKMLGGMVVNNNGAAITTTIIPSRQWDVVARYADLLSRIPTAAAAYALFDFFVINAEEDMALAALAVGEDDEDDEDDDRAVVEAIMAVERKVVMQRLMGLIAIVIGTVLWSLLSYHPVPFQEL